MYITTTYCVRILDVARSYLPFSILRPLPPCHYSRDETRVEKSRVTIHAWYLSNYDCFCAIITLIDSLTTRLVNFYDFFRFVSE